MSDAPAIRVKERNGVEFNGAIFRVETEADVLCVKINISVREHHAFGISARAAGVEKLGKRIFVDGSDVA